jgi:hypothetical protein
VFDGRNLYDPGLLESFGLRYFAIGRGGLPGVEEKRLPYGRRATDVATSKAS